MLDAVMRSLKNALPPSSCEEASPKRRGLYNNQRAGRQSFLRRADLQAD
jgi:hypothetical protein